MPSSTLPEWYKELRAVRLPLKTGVARLTGVGFLSGRKVCTPRDPMCSYKDSNIRVMEAFHPLYESKASSHSQDDYWNFIFHSACWDILCDRVLLDVTPSAVNDLARLLGELFLCTTWSRDGYIEPGHDFGGVAKFRQPFSYPLDEMIDAGFPWAAFAPSKLVSKEIFSSIAGGEILSPGEVVELRNTTGHDVFCRLPMDIIHSLLAFLPSSGDIRNLRLASRPVALVTRTSLQLPQTFWRCRFSSDADMGFALPLDADRGFTDWRSLYFSIRHGLRKQQIPDDLKNRKVIWDIVGIYAPLLRLHLRGLSLHGIPALTSLAQSRFLPAGDIITTKTMTTYSELLHVGSRLIFTRSLLPKLAEGEVCAFGISTITFTSRIYVSGLRVVYSSGSDSSTSIDHSLGYVMSSIDTLIRLPAYNFCGLELATCVDGIVGMRVLLDDGYHSAWVGNNGQGQPGVEFGVLSVKKNRSFNFVAGFDHFKMVALAVKFGGIED
ncbi:hypothetical protein AJ80_07799 [Polytolypa hystricis UAMH7299]|uniref:DUF7600 domain-containing protein n=1 Tax=Polytolypa hystricis (strain UAMH7299) TaxID=1447883 RepID=A0A2B7XJ01_POLH7|nr:hypothetical protein AJ80_07799 [Polytolypa hystricis UAMH7299]